MKKIVATTLVLKFLTSCVSTKNVPVTKEDSGSIKNKKIVIIHNPKPNFAATTYGNMMLAVLTGGILGTIKIIHDGNKIIKDNSIDDPAIMISQKLAQHIGSKYKAKITEENEIVDISSDAEEISKEYRNVADYVLYVRTINWSFGYLAMRTNSFRVIYSAKLNLIDTRNSKIIAEGFCARIPENNGQYFPTYNQLLANEAKILKEELAESVNFCADLFKEKIFN